MFEDIIDRDERLCSSAASIIEAYENDNHLDVAYLGLSEPKGYHAIRDYCRKLAGKRELNLRRLDYLRRLGVEDESDLRDCPWERW